jgi:hypothetical protein
MSNFLNLLSQIEYYGLIAINLVSFIYFLIDTHRFLKKVERDITASQELRKAAKKLVLKMNTEAVEHLNIDQDYWIEMSF